MIRPWLYALTAVVVTLILVNSALAQNPAGVVTIEGTVLDPSGASAPDAIVTLKLGSGKVLSHTKTDKWGRFSLAAVPPGTYSIEVQHKGFKTSTTALTVAKAPIAPLRGLRTIS
jgi:protocatechuate 3,4-dioxygenase beta subunit